MVVVKEVLFICLCEHLNHILLRLGASEVYLLEFICYESFDWCRKGFVKCKFLSAVMMTSAPHAPLLLMLSNQD